MCGIIPWHKWEKWEQYNEARKKVRITENWGMSAGIAHMQKRTCSKCGYTQYKEIKFTRADDV